MEDARQPDGYHRGAVVGGGGGGLLVRLESFELNCGPGLLTEKQLRGSSSSQEVESESWFSASHECHSV